MNSNRLVNAALLQIEFELKHDITLPHLAVLSAIANGARFRSEIADVAQIGIDSTYPLANGLKRAGYVESQKVKKETAGVMGTGQPYMYSVTEKGIDFLERLNNKSNLIFSSKEKMIFGKKFHNEKVTITRYAVLFLIGEGSNTNKAIINELGIRDTHLNRAVYHLKGGGFIKVVPRKKGEPTFYYLTEEGNNFLLKVDKYLELC